MDCVAFIVYSFSAKNPEWVIITELAFNKELNITFLLKSVINGATLIRARNFRLADFKSTLHGFESINPCLSL